MLEMKPLIPKGPLPDFIRLVHQMGALEQQAELAKDRLPTAFSVSIDTMGPEKVGGASFADAAGFDSRSDAMTLK